MYLPEISRRLLLLLPVLSRESFECIFERASYGPLSLTVMCGRLFKEHCQLPVADLRSTQPQQWPAATRRM